MTAPRDTLNALLDGLLPAAVNAGATTVGPQDLYAPKPAASSGDDEHGPNADEAALLADENARGGYTADAMRVLPEVARESVEVRLPSLSGSYILSPSWAARHHGGDDRHLTHADRAIGGGDDGSFAGAAQAPAAMAPLASGPAVVNGTVGNDVIDKHAEAPTGSAAYWELHGAGGNDYIVGYTTPDYLYGDSGSDTLVGGAGNDQIFGGVGFDYVDYEIEQGQQGVVVNFGPYDLPVILRPLLHSGEAYDSWGNRDSFLNYDVEGVGGTGFDDWITAANSASGVSYHFVGRGGNDDLAGGGGNDTLDGGVGNDRISGGVGDDYIIGAADDLVDQMTGGQGNDTLIGGGEDYAEGGDGDNEITAGHVTYNATTKVDLNLGGGYARHDTWIDTLYGVYWVKSGASNDKLVAGDRGVYFNAGDGLNTLEGGLGNDELRAGGGNDLFIGSLGSDVIDGGSGINTVDYINVVSEVAVNLRNERAIKTVGAGEDTLVAIKNVYGSNRADSIIGDDGVVGNYLNGRHGNDTIEGLAGNDDLHGDIGDDKILGGFGQDQLYGDEGNDSLDGGDGADRMEGGAGNDTYTVDNVNDVIVEAAGAGTDSVYTSFLTFSLGTTELANVENLSSVGSANFKLTGNGLANSIVGGKGLDTLDGSAGADTMVGGDASDTYTIDNLGDTPIEAAGAAAGTDDTAHVWVKNFDARKLVNIENVQTHGQGSINYRPDAPVAVETGTYTLVIDENKTGTVARINSKDDLNGGTLKYHLVNNFGGKFTIDPDSGIISVATGVDFENDPNLVTNTSNGKKYYNLEVYSVETETGALQSDNGTIQIEVRDVNEAPTAITYYNMSIDEKAEGDAQIGTPPVVSDPDGPAVFRNFTFSLYETPDGKKDGTGMFAIDANGTLRVGQGKLPDVTESTPYHVKVMVTDAGGLSHIEDVTVTVTPRENNKPYWPTPAPIPNVISENATGTVVVVQAEDDDNGGELFYRLVNDFGGKLSIDRKSGEIKVAAGIDFETDPDLTVIDEYTDHETKYFDAAVIAQESNEGQYTDPARVRVFIKNENEKATIALSNGNPYLQAGTTKADANVVKATAIDPDKGYSPFANNKFLFATGSNLDGSFEIDEQSGQVTAWRDLTTADTQPKTLQIVVYDAENAALFTKIDYVLNVAADVAPFDVRWNDGTLNVRVDENSSAVGTVRAQDNGGQENLHYELVPNAFFAIDATSGAITVKPDAQLNYEAAAAHTVEVIVTDANGLFTKQSLTVSLNDVNEAPTALTFSGHAIQVGKTVVGEIFATATATDPDTSNPNFRNNYFRFDNGTQDADKFTIDQQTGEITLSEDLNALEDDGRTVQLTVVTYDAGSTDLKKIETYSFTILAADNTAPRDVRFASGGSVDENATDPSTLVGQLTATDNGPESEFRFYMDDNPNSSVDERTGKVYVKATAQLDYESTEPYTVAIEVIDGEGKPSGRQLVTITLNDVNEAADSIAFISSGTPVKVGSTQVDTVFVTANAHDPDTNNPDFFVNNKYSFSTGNQTLENFTIDRDTGRISLSGELVAEDAGHYALEVVYFDEKDPNVRTTAIYEFDILSADNTPPTNIHWASGGSIHENTGPTTVGLLTGEDDGGASGLAYSMAENDLFGITLSGQVYLKGSPSFDYETQSVYHVDVTATDAAGDSTTQQIDITILDDNDAVDTVTVTAAAEPIQVGHTPVDGPVGQAVAHDPDMAEANTHNVFRFLDGSRRSFKFAIDDAGLITLAEPLVSGEEGSYTLDIVVYDVGDPLLRKVFSYTFEVLAAESTGNHDPDSLTLDGGISGNVQENRSGRQVGILVGSDPDAIDPESTLHYSLAPNGDPSGRFEVVGNVLKLKDHVAVDYEVNQSFTVRVMVSDAHGGSFARDLIINVTDETDDPNNNPNSLTFADLTTTARAREHVPNLVIGGSLFATDPDANDLGMLHFELMSDPSGKFRILENGSLALKDNAQLDYDSSGPDHEHVVVVRVHDGHGGYLDQILTIEVVSEDVIDAPPVISVVGDTLFTIDDAATVAPFTALTVGDAEDDAAGRLIRVSIDMGTSTGIFENLPDMSDFPGATVIYTLGDIVLQVIGTRDQINAILHRIQFNPNDEDVSVGIVTTTFNVTVFDSLGQSQSATSIVNAASTGVPNETPVIHVDPNGTVDWTGIPDTTAPFAAFAALSITDDGPFVSVNIIFDPAQGDFVLPTGDFGVEFDFDHDGAAFNVRGAPGNVSAFIQALLYSPADYLSDPVGTTHPTTIFFEVVDSRSAQTVKDVSIQVVTANRAPDQIHLVDFADVPEDAGVNFEFASLSARDLNGDAIVAYRLSGTAGDKFKLKHMPDGRWALLVNGPLDFEEGAPFHENGKTWYEIKVQASDGTDWSAEQTLKVFIADVEPDNSAPVITVNGSTTWQVEDTGTVAPFANMTLSDAEDGAADPAQSMTITLAVEDNSGVFVMPDMVLFPGITLVWDPAQPTNVMATGLQGDLTAFIHAVQFNPVNRPGDAGNPATRVQAGALTIQLFDSNNANTSQQVIVESTATGQAADNRTPTITVSDHTATQATDHGLAVLPFTHVTLADFETDDVNVLTITFNWQEGELFGAGVEGVKSGNRITYTLIGKAADLTLLLQGLTFDPTNHDGPGDPVTTRFDIALNDAHHAIGSADHVEVVTTVTGPTGPTNDTYIVDADNPNPVINEVSDPSVGGYDRAIVSIDAYTLAAGQGVETLEAANTVDHGITLVGNDLANTVIGGIGNDTLEGGGVTGPVMATNQDVLRGGLGNDTYVVRQAGVVIEELADAGLDTVRIVGDGFGDGWTYTLGANLETLDGSASTGSSTLVGNGLDNLILGNASANTLQGLDGNDTLDGGAGAADSLEGGVGDDTYRIRNAGDVIIEGVDPADGANDVAQVFVQKYDLADGVGIELVQAQNTGAGVWLIGNDYANILEGNVHDDTLDGGNGSVAHRLIGGAGNDIYVIRNSGDQVTDTSGTGDEAYVYTKDFTTIAARDAFILDLKTIRGIENVHIDQVAPGGDNAAPTGLTLSGNWAREWARDGFVVASLEAEDSDGPSGSYTFKFVIGTDATGHAILSDTDTAGRFTIVGNQLWVLDGSKLDFEVSRSHKLMIQVSDDSGVHQTEVSITVRDLLNESGTGKAGAETFKGGAGDDVFDGAGGNDTLAGGFGSDDLTGGDGNDAFVFDKDMVADEFDTIQDFNQGEDLIHLKASVFQLDGFEGGPLDASVFGLGAEATTDTQRILYDKDTGTLFYDEDGTGSAQAIMIAVLDESHRPELNRFDFLVIL